MDTILYASALLFGMGLIFIIIGLVKIRLMKNGKTKSKIKIEGVIDSIEEKKVIENGNEITKYFPTYSFTVGKKKIKGASETGYYKCQVAKGDKVVIYHNEVDPEEFYVEDELQVQLSRIFIFAGVILILLAAVFAGMFFKM